MRSLALGEINHVTGHKSQGHFSDGIPLYTLLSRARTGSIMVRCWESPARDAVQLLVEGAGMSGSETTFVLFAPQLIPTRVDYVHSSRRPGTPMRTPSRRRRDAG